MGSTNGSAMTLSWCVFVLIVLGALFVAFGFPAEPILILLAVVGLIFTYRATYLSFYLGVALTPFLGIILSIPTGNLELGQRAFGGSIDVSAAELVLCAVMFVWAIKVLRLWVKRRDQNWRPRLPAAESYLLLVIAHLASAFSPIQPDPELVVKYSLHPVLFNYLAFVALPANLIRSRRRLVSVLAVLCCVGVFAAATGLASMFFPAGGGFIGRAHPLAIFGVAALGENHNELADILVFTTLFTLALAELTKKEPTRRLVRFAALFQLAIGLLTFTRTAWIVFGLQAIVLAATEWRETIRTHLRTLSVALVLLIPLALGMIAYSLSATAQSSNSTRLMLTQIATELFLSSPIVGAGAGTFLERVGSTQVFLLEYGAPLDSHGFLQKIAAETGLFGLFALALLVWQIGQLFWKTQRSMTDAVWRRAHLLLIVGATGAFVYQLFNTDYWSAKLWLPIGIALASAQALKDV